MKTNAAVLTERNAPWEIMELDVRDPKEGEVLIRYTAAGLCHSDMHLVTGDLPSPLPYVGGHEGAGVIEAVGPGVRRWLKAITSSAPSSRRAVTAAGARPVARACATWARRSSTDISPMAPTARRSTARASARCACSARSRSTPRSGRNRSSRSTRTCRSRSRCCRLRRADGLGLGGQHRQRPDRRHRDHLRHRRDRSERGPGRLPRGRDADHRGRSAGVQARVRPGDRRHPRRDERRGGRSSSPSRTPPAAPTWRSSPSTWSTSRWCKPPRPRCARTARRA